MTAGAIGELSGVAFEHYLDSLVGKFFKILPIKEGGDDTLLVYMESLRAELLGCRSLCKLEEDDGFVVLLSILEYLIQSDCETAVVKREVFKAISQCKKLKLRYGGKG